jgi:hypothetical protein
VSATATRWDTEEAARLARGLTATPPAPTHRTRTSSPSAELTEWCWRPRSGATGGLMLRASGSSCGRPGEKHRGGRREHRGLHRTHARRLTDGSSGVPGAPRAGPHRRRRTQMAVVGASSRSFLRGLGLLYLGDAMSALRPGPMLPDAPPFHLPIHQEQLLLLSNSCSTQQRGASWTR